MVVVQLCSNEPVSYYRDSVYTKLTSEELISSCEDDDEKSE